MRFYFPDSQDQIDPSFDFETEERSPFRIRQRDDLYAHEVLDARAVHGHAVSKAMVDGVAGGAGRYSAQQRQRLYRVGIREFFRLDDAPGPRLDTIGDCGAFTYVREDVPPYSVDEVIDFYEGFGFDAACLVDHVILGFELQPPTARTISCRRNGVAPRSMTLELADEFLQRHRRARLHLRAGRRRAGLEPGVLRRRRSIDCRRSATSASRSAAWSPQKTHEILAVLEAIATVREPRTRNCTCSASPACEHVPTFADLGVTSFDSTSPFRQAFKDDRDNYYALDRTYVALRVPQVDGNAKLQRRIRAGEVDRRHARRLEQAALATLRAFDRGERDHRRGRRRPARVRSSCTTRHATAARPTARCSTAAPWKSCDCAVCRDVGIQVIIFRGTERNKRRGFHNLHVFAQRLARARRTPRRVPASARSRMSPSKPTTADELVLPALAISQAGDRTLYSFAVDGKKLPSFAAVSRVKRDEQHELAGYQRAESLAHIRTIRKYLESADAMLPNALVVAFDSRVRFEPSGSTPSTGVSIGRTASIPVDEAEAEHRQARLDRRRPAAVRGDPRRRRRQLPGLRHGVHHRQRRRAALAVHPRQLHEAPAQGPHPRIAAIDTGRRPAARAAEAALPRAAARPPQLRRRLAAAAAHPHADDRRRHDQGQLHPEDARR